MKGFKNTTRTQSGHGFNETPTRPATAKDVAAAKAVRIITPGKQTPRVTNGMILGESEDRAPGERGGKKFAVGGQVTRGNRVSFDESFDDKNAWRSESPKSTSSQTFKQAFAANRAAGKDTFVWNGKRYTTDLAEPSKLKAQASLSNSADRQVAPVRAPVKSVPVAPTKPLISASKPKSTFRENFERSMGDDSPEAKARLDAKAAARGKALSDAVSFVVKGDGKPRPSFRENFERSMGDDSPAAKAKNDAKAASRGKAVRDAVNFVLKGDGKPHPSFRENFERSMGGDKPKRFAVGGPVSSGMPAQGRPITNANDARVRPPMQRPQRNDGLPQAWRDNYAADSARRLGTNPQPTARDLANRAADAARSTGKPAEPTLPTTKSSGPAPTSYRDQLSNYKGPLAESPAPTRPTSAQMAALPTIKPGYRKGGVVEKGSKEVYASKAAMKKHEGKESKSKERAEHKQEGGELLAGRAQSLRDMVGKPQGRPGYAKGGKSRWS